MTKYLRNIILNRNNLLLLFLVVFFSTCKKEFISETESNSTIKYLLGGTEDKVFAAEKTNDGGFIYCGNTVLGNHINAFLLKVNAEGEKEWYKTYGGAFSDYFFNVIQTKDGGYIAVGTTNSFGKGTWDTTNSFNDMVVKTDANGEQIWIRSFNQNSNIYRSRANGIVEATPDRFFITGGIEFTTSTTMYSYIQQITGNGHLLTISNGTPDSTELYNERDYYQYNLGFTNLLSYPPGLVHANYYHSFGVSLTVAGPGKLLIGGLMSYSNIPGEAGQYLNFLMDYDADARRINFFHPYYGYERWYSYWLDNPRIYSPVIVKVLSDGYLIASYIEYKVGKLKMQLMKTDYSGYISWVKDYTGLGYSILESIEVNPDGSILLVGGSSKDPINGSYPELFANMKVALVKVSSNGEEIWSKFIGGETNTTVGKAAQLKSDGGYAIACSSCSSETGYHKIFTIQIDKNGDLITN